MNADLAARLRDEIAALRAVDWWNPQFGAVADRAIEYFTEAANELKTAKAERRQAQYENAQCRNMLQREESVSARREQRIKELEAERDAYVDVKNDTLGKLWAAEARLAAAERVVEAIRAVQRFDRHHPTARFSRDICGGPEPFGSFVPQIARCAVCEVLAAAERVVETGLRWMQDPNNGALQDEHADALERRIKELEAELFEANQHRVDEAVLGDISRLAETEARLAAAERWMRHAQNEHADECGTCNDFARTTSADSQNLNSAKPDWVQKSEWVDPIVKDALSGKRKPPGGRP